MTVKSNTITATGMTCAHREMAVTAELSKLDGVTRIDVVLASGTVLTEIVATLPVDAAAAIDEAGYELSR